MPATVDVKPVFLVAAFPLPAERRSIRRLRPSPGSTGISADIPAHHVEGSAAVQVDRMPDSIGILVVLAVKPSAAGVQPTLHPATVWPDPGFDIKAKPYVPLCGQLRYGHWIVPARAISD